LNLVKKDNSLNQKQEEAAKSINGPILVIAGAGTGKTKTLVHRMFHLVENGTSPESILLLTFTKRAALEMLSRASSLLDHRMEKVQGGTFHGFSHLFLRKYGSAVSIPSNFSILDIEDAEQLVGIAREEILSNATSKRFPKKETLLEIISTSFNANLSLEKVIQKDFPQFIRELKEIYKIKERFEELKWKSNCLDFDDLLLYTRKILVEFKHIREQISIKYKSVLVDEYQDTNKIQAHIACLLASEHNNIMVVGDDAQSIYKFRGADVRNILDFPKIFPDTKLIVLEENYRSTKGILNLANVCLSKFKEKYDKRLFTKNTDIDSLPNLSTFTSREKESTSICDQILSQNENGIKFSEIAILTRSGWHSNLIELELGARNIPFKKFGGRRFLDQAHVKDMIAYLRVLINPLDFIAWNRILLLEESVGPKQAFLLIQTIQKLDSDFFAKPVWREESFWMNFTKEAKDNLNQLLEFLFRCKDKFDAPTLAIFEEILNYYLPILKLKFDDHEKRSQDLETLKLIANQRTSLLEFLATLTLDPTESYGNHGKIDREEEGFVTISTIHSAKGLEWESVFMINMLDGDFPSSRIKTLEDLEEERRLFYVGVTRAKRLLNFSVALVNEGNQTQLRPLSRFLQEISADHFKLIEEDIEKTNAQSLLTHEKNNSGKTFDQIQSYFLN